MLSAASLAAQLHSLAAFVALLSQLACMQQGWSELFYCCLFQGRAWLQGICPGFSMPLDCTGCVCGGSHMVALDWVSPGRGALWFKECASGGAALS